MYWSWCWVRLCILANHAKENIVLREETDPEGVECRVRFCPFGALVLEGTSQKLRDEGLCVHSLMSLFVGVDDAYGESDLAHRLISISLEGIQLL
jgi:hypothetical protein